MGTVISTELGTRARPWRPLEQQAGTDIHMRPPVEVKAGAAAPSGSHIPASQLELEHSHLAQSLDALEDSPDVCFVRAARPLEMTVDR